MPSFVCDLDNVIVYWNESAGRIYGWTAAEAIGKDMMEVLFHAKPPSQVHEMMKNVDERGE
jgi:PAS domain S-box-containing protein